MNKKRLAAGRAELERRTAGFKKVQIAFERDRHQFYDETITRAKNALAEGKNDQSGKPLPR